jgi:hypothetical protein
VAFVLVVATVIYFLPARPETPGQEWSKPVAGQPDTVAGSNEEVELLGIDASNVREINRASVVDGRVLGRGDGDGARVARKQQNPAGEI